MSVAGGLLLRRKKIIRGLEKAGAVSPETAVSLQEIGFLLPNAYGRYTERLIARGKINRTEDGKYYL